jgi:two-component system, chemotaxis family, chemotaxis protein CheY
VAKILVVDDDPAVRELLKDLLQGEGHVVDTAENGMVGIGKLGEGGFQLATLDVDMPLLNGIEVLKLIRRDAKLLKLPVLMCTAHNSMEALDAAFAIGATGYFVKPLNIEELRKTVKKALGSAPKPDEFKSF